MLRGGRPRGSPAAHDPRSARAGAGRVRKGPGRPLRSDGVDAFAGGPGPSPGRPRSTRWCSTREPAVRLTVAAVLAGGHVLIEDVPGVGKTSLAKALAASIGGSVGRVQGTPDLLPADITGFSVFNPASGEWTFRPGPIFHNVVLVDEVNRATPRAQSALLEAMAEGQVTVDGVDPPAARRRSACWPPRTRSRRRRHVPALRRPARPLRGGGVARPAGPGGRAGGGARARGARPRSPSSRPVARTEPVVAARLRELEDLHVARPVIDYVLDIVDAVRRHPEVHSRRQPPREPAAVPGRRGRWPRSTVGATSCPRTSRRPRRPCSPTAWTCAAGAASRRVTG